VPDINIYSLLDNKRVPIQACSEQSEVHQHSPLVVVSWVGVESVVRVVVRPWGLVMGLSLP
jgi:hypothetical protein